jgi:hypothetical protein
MSTKQPTWAIRVTEENAAELEAWRIQQPEALCVNDYILTNSVKDNSIVYLLSSQYDDSYQFWAPLDGPHAEVDQIINLEEWRAITSKSKSKSKTTKLESMSKTTLPTQKITREAFESIYNVACSTWKSKLESFVADQGLFKKVYILTEEQVDEMFKASSSEQKAVLVKAGLKQSGPAKIDLTKEIVISPDGLETFNPLTKNEGSDQMISVRCSTGDKYDGNCYYLSNRFEWTIEQDHSTTVLVPKFKG